MKAFVTGAAGFVGRHMVRALRERGWGVDSVDLEPTDVDYDLRRPPHLHIIGDAHRLFREHTHRYDLVVHAAAVEPHRAAIDSKPTLLAKNLMLDAAMFDWAVRTRQYRVLYLSSSAAYPVGFQAGHVPYRLAEDDADPTRQVTGELVRALGSLGPLQPDANYGWTKLTGERMAAAANETDIQTHIVRPFSGYGEDQSLNFPFPAIVDRARRGDLTVWGPPGQTRDWIHVSDLVRGALAVVESGDTRPVNLCTGIGTEMGDLALMVARAAGHDPVGGVQYQEDKPTGVKHRVGCPARLWEHYTPKVSIEEGVRRALA